MVLKRIILMLLVFITISCDKKTSEEETHLSQLSLQEQLWNSKKIDSYSFTQRISCFCRYEFTLPKQVIVSDGLVVSVAGEPYDATIHQSILTIQGRFAGQTHHNLSIFSKY